jgi:hypothetical protein
MSTAPATLNPARPPPVHVVPSAHLSRYHLRPPVAAPQLPHARTVGLASPLFPAARPAPPSVTAAAPHTGILRARGKQDLKRRSKPDDAHKEVEAALGSLQHNKESAKQKQEAAAAEAAGRPGPPSPPKCPVPSPTPAPPVRACSLSHRC